MPTEIEGAYLEQGYRLSEALTWGMAGERSASRRIADLLDSIAVACRGIGWSLHTSTVWRSSIPDIAPEGFRDAH